METLVKYAKNRLNLKRFSFIVADDSYGRDAVELLKKKCLEYDMNYTKGIYLDTLYSAENIKDAVQSSHLFDEKIDAILIAHYSDANYHLVEALDRLSPKQYLFAAASLGNKLKLEKSFKVLLENKNYLVSYPFYKAKDDKYRDTEANFMYFTME